jgi:hypothetical protein
MRSFVTLWLFSKVSFGLFHTHHSRLKSSQKTVRIGPETDPQWGSDFPLELAGIYIRYIYIITTYYYQKTTLINPYKRDYAKPIHLAVITGKKQKKQTPLKSIFSSSTGKLLSPG